MKCLLFLTLLNKDLKEPCPFCHSHLFSILNKRVSTLSLLRQNKEQIYGLDKKLRRLSEGHSLKGRKSRNIIKEPYRGWRAYSLRRKGNSMRRVPKMVHCQAGWQDGAESIWRIQAEHSLLSVQIPLTACNLTQLPPSVPAIICETEVWSALSPAGIVADTK